MTSRAAALRQGYDRDNAIAWVCEEISDPVLDEGGEPPDMALGLFDAHVQALELPRGMIKGPHRVPVEEAIAWARPLAAKVVVRVCAAEGKTSFWSAGERPVETMNVGRRARVPVPTWPEAGLPHLRKRRAPGYKYLDRTSDDPPIGWDVVATVIPAFGETVAGFHTDLQPRLAEDQRVTEVVDFRGPTGPFPWEMSYPEDEVLIAYAFESHPAARVLLRLSASTLGEAEQLARDCVWAAARPLLDGCLLEQRGDEWTWYVNVAAWPTGSRLARLNARLGSPGP